MVAPLAGAWIETLLAGMGLDAKAVAPLAGAWIETAYQGELVSEISSHPLRVRGLKLFSKQNNAFALISHPFAGAWIETSRA